jgi:cyclohexanone monooxygenase
MTESQQQAARTTSGAQFDAVIVGAGFAGMYMLYRLRALGFSVRVFEAASGVGGTWYWNRYPGARCDVESVQYSYQFSDELQQDWEWTEKYATQPEILRYANHVADRFDLKRDIQFDTQVTSAAFDEARNRWTMRTDEGVDIDAAFCIMATGCLSATNTPRFEGLDAFTGAVYHTGQWPHEGVDFTGQRVGVIGTGSSAIQSIPLIAEQARHLFVFQRTPHYTVPARNAPLDAAHKRQVKAHYPALRARAKQMFAGIDFALNDKPAIEAAPEERRREYEARWVHGSAVQRAVQCDGRGIRARQDPRDRARPEARASVGAPLRDRLQTAMRRYRILRNVQPCQRNAGRLERCADRSDHARGRQSER